MEGEAVGGIQILAISSVMDEAWQILHHIRSADNPLAVKQSITSYLLASLRSRRSRNSDIDRLLGGDLFDFLGRRAQKCITSFQKLVYLLIILSVLFDSFWFFGLVPFLLVLFSLLFFLFITPAEQRFLMSGSLNYPQYAGDRQLAQLIEAFSSVPIDVLTYVIRRKGWPVVVAMAMGLEGYRFELPNIEQRPVSKHLIVTYEDLPEAAVTRALSQRGDWIKRHLGDVSETFSKLAVTNTDIGSLLHKVAEDQTLVHAAYYTDDECIDRIADWIAGRG